MKFAVFAFLLATLAIFNSLTIFLEYSFVYYFVCLTTIVRKFLYGFERVKITMC